MSLISVVRRSGAYDPSGAFPVAVATTVPSARQIALALLAAGIIVLPTIVLWPHADFSGPELPVAIGIYQSAVVLADLLTAALLLIQFLQLQTRDLLVLACTYLATALFAGLQLLSFPNVAGAHGLMGGNPQTPPWLWNFWHMAFPIGVMAFTMTNRPIHGDARRAAALGFGVTVAVVIAATLLATTYVSYLPKLIDNTAFSAIFLYVNYPTMVALCLAALITVVSKRPRSLVSLWLAVSVLAFMLDVVNNWHSGARYALGWYVGRASGLASSLLLLMVFVLETAFLLRYVASAAQKLNALNDDLAAALAAAKSADLAKTRFLAAASHDLRQPFQAMRLFHGVLDQQITDARQRQVVQHLGQAMSAGEALLTSLLDVARLDSGTVQVNRRSVDLAGLVKDVAAEFEPVAAEKGLRLRVACSAPVIETDSILLRRVLANLVSNALRYTERGGVLIGVRQRSDRLVLEVWDSGVGIDSAAAALIFEEFYQLGNSSRDRAQGLGLGLAIVRRLCALLGYEVSLESRSGRGSVFRVTMDRTR